MSDKIIDILNIYSNAKIRNEGIKPRWRSYRYFKKPEKK